ncbi:MAG: hypothetical protein HY290_19300 [Planctomycetia bacterium]|nr:hypothetical protein [Planctomycetia bacterium]
MSPADASRGAVNAPRPVTPPPSEFFRQIARFLYTQNPFYLLSVAFVLHSTRLWYRQAAGPFDPWPLMAIICGYIVLVAAVGFVLVRFGKVWDDARSIFLILLLLFVEISLTFDGVLVSQPATGRTLLLIGLALAAVVSEALLIGLRIRLPVLYRAPFHLFLALLFLYPLAIVTGLGDDTSAAVWRVYLFSPVAAAVLLTLLPAIRRGPQYVAETGTPWRWPWFPWSLFGFLTICTGLRSYALSLSFDTVLMQKLNDAMRLDSAFGLYFLAPLLLAVAVLLLEAGIVARSRRIQILALVTPFVCLVLSMTPRGGSAPYADFLARFMGRIGSPLWLSVIAGMAFLAYARLRKVRYAGESFWAALLIVSCVSRATVDLDGVVPPQTWALWFAAVVQGVAGVRQRRSWRVFASAICAIAALRSDLLVRFETVYRNGMPLLAAGIAVLAVGALFDDAFARCLRGAGVPMLVTAAIFTAAFPGAYVDGLPAWSAPSFGAAIAGATLAYAYAICSPVYFFTGLANVVLFLGRTLYELAGGLRRMFDWEGATWFVWGLVWFALGAMISARKAGLANWLARFVPRGRKESA